MKDLEQAPDKMTFVFDTPFIGVLNLKKEAVEYIRKDALWKPTPEQLKALNAINCFGELSYQGQQQYLIELYKQLKQLCNEQ